MREQQQQQHIQSQASCVATAVVAVVIVVVVVVVVIVVLRSSVQFSSVTIFYPRKSYNKVMTAALICSSCVRTTQSLAGW